MFKEKTDSELAAMDAVVLAAYFKEKATDDRAKIDDAIAAKASRIDIDAMKAELIASNTKSIDALNEALKAQGLEIARIASGGNGAVKEKTLREQLAAKSAELVALKGGDNKRVILDVKVAGTMTIAGNTTGEIPQSMREPGLNRIARRRPFVSDYINRAQTASPAVSWVEQVNPDGAPAFIAEGVLKPAIDFDMIVVTETAKKIAAHVKVSKEMLDDIPFMSSEIENDLIERINLATDTQLLTGDGIGNNLNGLITQATAFAAGAFAGTIEAANNYDVLMVAFNQIVVANFMPSTVFLHPTDMTAMQLTKGTDGHYIRFPFVSENGQRFMDVMIVANSGVPVGAFLIFDGGKAGIFQREGLTVNIGYSDDDFVKNLVTILGEQRLLVRIKGNDTLAFVSGTFTAAKAALETP